MKKLFSGILVVIIIAVGITPFVTGLLAEKYVRQAVENVNSMYSDAGLDYKVEIKDYNRGFLSSSIDWVVHTGDLEAFYGVKEILFHEEASHGFGTVTSETKLEQNPWFMSFVNDKLGGKNPLSITTRYNVFGISTSTCSLDAFSLAIEEETIDFQPGTISISVDKELKHFSTTFDFGGMSIGEELAVTSLKAHADLEMFSTYIWDGIINYSIGAIKITDQQQEEAEVLEINDLTIGYVLNYEEAKSALSCAIDYGAANISSNGTDLVTKPTMTLEINGLNSTAFEEFMAVYMKFITDALEAGLLEPENQEAAQAVLEQQLMGLGMQLLGVAEKFLQKDLEINFKDVQATLPEGTIEGGLSIRLNQDVSIAQLMPLTSQPDLAFEYFSITSNLRIPAALIGDTTMLTSPALPGMQTGMFTVDGEYLQHASKTENGKFFLNGKEFSLQPLLQQ